MYIHIKIFIEFVYYNVIINDTYTDILERLEDKD